MISIIVPVYKVEPYIRRCVDSILSQTYSEFELILVNDGSPDSCGAICDEYADKDSRIRVIHKENGGLSSARNAALDVVCAEKRAEWITFIDSDDWVHPKYLELLLSMAMESGVKLAVGNSVTTYGEENDKSLEGFCVYSPEEFWIKTRSAIACAKLYRRELFENERYPIGKLHEDEFITYRLVFSCDRVAYTPSKIYYYYINSQGIVHSLWTPKKMHGIEAIINSRNYFKNNGHKKARKKEEIVLAGVYYDNINLARANNEDGKYDGEIESMISGLREHLSKNSKYVPIRNAQAIYILAFPEREKSIRKKAARRQKAVAFIKKILKTLGIRK